MKRIALLLFVLFAVAACTYDNEEELFNCDASAVRYSTTITGLVSAYGCLGCHGNFSPSGGINLSTYAGVKAMADSRRLYGSVNHEPGFRPMPEGGSKMNACDLRKLKAWIDAGAPNN